MDSRGGVGYVGNLVNGEVGFAMRIAALRRSAPKTTPRLGTLALTEVLVELVLAILVSFYARSPLGWPWWVPVVLVAVMAGVTVAVSRLGVGERARRWLAGLAVLRDANARWRMAVAVLVAVVAQITGALGSLAWGGWALGDRGWAARRQLNRLLAHRARTRRAEGAAAGVQAALGALPLLRRQRLESTYFGGVTQAHVARILFPFHTHRAQPA